MYIHLENSDKILGFHLTKFVIWSKYRNANHSEKIHDDLPYEWLTSHLIHNEQILCYDRRNYQKAQSLTTPVTLVQEPGQIHRTAGFKSARHYRWQENLFQQGIKLALQGDPQSLQRSFQACFHHWINKQQLDKAFMSRYIYFQALTFISGQDAARQVAMETMKDVQSAGYFANMNFIAATQYIFVAIRNINARNLVVAEELIQKACMELQYTEVSEWKAELYQCLCR